jgi:hypothetical protein
MNLSREKLAEAAQGCNFWLMNSALSARDLWPLLFKLPHDEQVRLAKLALRAASQNGLQDARASGATPPRKEEFTVEEDPLAWEADGWDEFD